MGEGLGPRNRDFFAILGPVKRHRAVRRVPFGAPKRAKSVLIFILLKHDDIGTYMHMCLQRILVTGHSPPSSILS